MAIVKMKKLQVIAPASQCDRLLKELLLMGCVELTAQDTGQDDSAGALSIRRDHGELMGTRTERQTYSEALRILDQYAPKKTPMLSPKPEVSTAELMDDAQDAALKQTAKELAALDEKMRSLSAEETREKLRIETLAPWKDCELPLDCQGTKHVAALFGMLPTGTDMDALSAVLAGGEVSAQLFEVSADENAHYVYVLHLRSEKEAVMKLLREHGFTAPAYGEFHGSAADGVAASEKALEEIAAQRQETQVCIADAAEYRDALRTAYDRAGTRVDRAEATELLLRTESTVLLSGWADAERESETAALLEQLDCAYEFTDPAEEEYPLVPVKLRNNKLTDGLNMVTNMYSLPQYGTVDPNPLIAPFFILFYGIMMADIGYGLIMMLIGGIILWKKKPQDGFMKYFSELMVEGGIATLIMGILSGGCFGDAPYQIVHLLNPESTWEGLPALFDPLNDTILVLVGAMILGFIHLNVGLIVSFAMKTRGGHLADAIWGEGIMWVLFLGIASAVLGFGSIGGIPVLLIVSLLLYCYGKTRDGKGMIGKIIAIFSGVYSDATGWFGDILSYARLMALMLAGSVIAQVFNNLGAMPGSILIFIPIFLLGNTLNFGLNLLGCYVHDLRLQCLEFFGKFYVDGGKPFKPLAVRSKYFNVVK